MSSSVFSKDLKLGGGKHWRMKYRTHGKEKKLSFGCYPGGSLVRARRLCDAQNFWQSVDEANAFDLRIYWKSDIADKAAV